VTELRHQNMIPSVGQYNTTSGMILSINRESTRQRMRNILQTLSILLMLLLGFGANAAAELAVTSIVIEGLKRSEKITVLRELPFNEGVVWQDEFAASGEKRLRNLGIFSDVRITAPDKDGTVRIFLKEQWSFWLLPQATRKDNGASSASVVIDEYNLWGLNHHGHLGYSWETGKNFSSFRGGNYNGAYNWRRVGDSRLSLSISGNHSHGISQTYSQGLVTASYDQRSDSGSMLFSYALDSVPNEGWNTLFGLSGSNTSYTLISGIVPQNNLLQSNHARTILGGISFTDIDNHFTWMTGTAFSYSLAISRRSFGSTHNSYTQNASWQKHHAFSGEHTVNFRLNGGLSGSDAQQAGLFDIGNRNALRGYYPGELQGSKYLFGSIEGRFPIQKGSNFQLVAFSDAGVIGGAGGASIAKGLAVGAGGGFRWTLRWLVNGTIRTDVAYGLASKRWRFYLGTGQAF